MQPARIIHVCGRMKLGGITRFVESIVGLNPAFATRHDMLLTFADGPEPKGDGYAIHRLELGRAGALACLRNARRIYRDYDAVMLHGAHPLVVFPLIGMRRRVFFFQHGMAVSSGGRWIRLARKAWYSVAPRILGAHTICSTEYALRKSLALGIKLQRDRIHIVPFGTDMRPAHHARNRPAGARLTIGMAGRLDGQKRHDLVLESLKGYSGRRPIELLIAGDGAERARLEQLAATLPADRVRVTFLGAVEDMEGFYDQLDVLAFPSRGESFGLVPLEALMRSVPVAVFADVGGCLPLVRSGETGFVALEGADGLRAIWQTLDARPEVLAGLRAKIATLDLSEFGIGRTRAELDRLASAETSDEARGAIFA